MNSSFIQTEIDKINKNKNVNYFGNEIEIENNANVNMHIKVTSNKNETKIVKNVKNYKSNLISLNNDLNSKFFKNQWLECGKFFVQKSNSFLIKCCFCSYTFNDTQVFVTHINCHNNQHGYNEKLQETTLANNAKETELSDIDIFQSERKMEFTIRGNIIEEEYANPLLQKEFFVNSEETMKPKEMESRKQEASIESNSDVPKSKRDPSDGLFHCTKCPKIVKRFDILKDHFYLKHTWHQKLKNENEVPLMPVNKKDQYDNKYHCTACLSSHGTYKALLRHFRNHPGTNIIENKPFKCALCTSRFWTEQELKMHEIIHSQERPREFKCEMCSKTFPRKVELNKHISTTHHKNKPYKCEYCPKTFPSKSNKDAHEMLHLNSRPHLCETCGAAHVSRAKLEYHKRRHTGEKSFKCQHCDKAFFDSKRLKDHLPVHTGERNEPCDMCEKKFSTRKQMMKHRKIHFDEKTYFCTFCGEAFKQDSALYRHKKNVHKNFVCF